MGPWKKVSKGRENCQEQHCRTAFGAAAESTVVHFRLQNVVNARQPARQKAPADNGSSVSATDARLRLALDVLGAFELKRADGQLLRLPKKAQALLAYLALQKGRAIPREQLATLLWGNSATEQARQSLRQCLAALRNVLGAEASEWIVADTASVLLAPSELLAIDVTAFEAACQSKTVADMERASALYRDELLTGLQIPVEPFNDWLTLERQRLLSLRLDLLQRLAVAKAEARDMEGAIGAARHVTALDPLREEGHRLLMRLLASSAIAAPRSSSTSAACRCSATSWASPPRQRRRSSRRRSAPAAAWRPSQPSCRRPSRRTNRKPPLSRRRPRPVRRCPTSPRSSSFRSPI